MAKIEENHSNINITVLNPDCFPSPINELRNPQRFQLRELEISFNGANVTLQSQNNEALKVENLTDLINGSITTINDLKKFLEKNDIVISVIDGEGGANLNEYLTLPLAKDVIISNFSLPNNSTLIVPEGVTNFSLQDINIGENVTIKCRNEKTDLTLKNTEMPHNTISVVNDLFNRYNSALTACFSVLGTEQ